MPSLALIRDGCGAECLVSFFDSGCGLASCTELNSCISDFRTVIACDSCTCLEIFGEALVVDGACTRTTGVEITSSEGSPGSPKTDCFCEDADDFSSVDVTKMVLTVNVNWDLARIFREDVFCTLEYRNVETITEVAATTCPEDPHSVWNLYVSNETTNLACPTDSSDWTFLAGPFVDADSGILGGVDYTIPLEEVPGHPGFYDCANRPHPHFLLEIHDACGHKLTACPVQYVSEDILTCPTCEPGNCCTATIEHDPLLTFAGDCIDDSLEVDVTINIDCSADTCTPSTGTGTVSISGPGIDFQSEPISGTSGTPILVVFTTPCTIPFGPINVALTWIWDNVETNCDPSVNCGTAFDCPPIIEDGWSIEV